MIRFKQPMYARLTGPKGKARTRWVATPPNTDRIVFRNVKFTKAATRVEIVDTWMKPVLVLGIPAVFNYNPDDDVVVLLGRNC